MIPWQRMVDFLVTAIALYALLRWARHARALRMALSGLALHVLALLAQRFNLLLTGWILDLSAILVGVLLLLLFPAELRQAMMILDRAVRMRTTPSKLPPWSSSLAEGAFKLAGVGLGALIVIPRKDSLNELMAAGTRFGATVLPDVLMSVFQKYSPLHDGAAVIDGNCIKAVNVVLPLTRRTDLPVQFGTRHRAALGISEYTDALVVVVSEETGEVRLVSRGEMNEIANAAELVRGLEEEMDPKPAGARRRLRSLFVADAKLKAAAVALSAVVWTVTFLAPRTTVRTIVVPIEFRNLPSGMKVVEQSASAIEVDVRANSLVAGSLNAASLVARLDMTGSGAGVRKMRVTADCLNLAPGLSADSIEPSTVSVRLEPARR